MVTKEYFGEEFRIQTDVCESCGATLWTEAVQAKLNEWLGKLDQSKRDRFTIQFYLSKAALQCLDRLTAVFPGSDRAKILRAMVMFYVERVAPKQEWANLVEAITAREVFSHLTNGEKSTVKVHFNPYALLDVQSLANLADMKTRELAEEAVLRIFAFYIENDPEMHDFWQTNILPDLSLILKSA